MQIAFFSNAYKPAISGVVTSIARFRKGLQARGHQVHIFAPEYETFVDDEPYIFRFPALDLTEQLNVSLVMPIRNLMWPAVRGVKPALIHSQHPVLMGDIAAAFARQLKVPLVFTFHTQYEKYAQFYSPIGGRLAGLVTEEMVDRYLSHCDHVIVPTDSVREMVEDEFGLTEQVSVVPTPVDLEAFEGLDPTPVRERYVPGESKLLLYVGRIAKEKGLNFLLGAFGQIVSQRPDVNLLMVGTGPQLDEFKARTRKEGLAEKVFFAGAVSPDEVPAYYAAADLFVFTSSSETQGLVLIEAMAAGTPVVTVRAPGPQDVLAEGGGRLVSADSSAFSDEVLALLNSPDEREKLAAEARQAVRRYGIPNAAEQLLDAYQRALDK